MTKRMTDERWTWLMDLNGWSGVEQKEIAEEAARARESEESAQARIRELEEALEWLLQDACSDKGRGCLHTSHKKAFVALAQRGDRSLG